MVKEWKDVLINYADSRVPEELERLKEEEGQFLLYQLRRLRSLKELKELYSLEMEQEESGAGFYGLLSSPLPDINEFDLEETEEDLIKAVSLLTKSRENAKNQIKEKMPYTLNFKGKEPSLPDIKDYSPGRIELKTEGLKNLLHCMEEEDYKGVSSLVEHETFAEMLKHRKDLGYIPEPVMDTKGLRRMFLHGVSRKPLDEIWKWINLQNFFDTGDYYFNQKAYRETISILENQWSTFEQVILGVIHEFSPDGFVFCDTFSLGLGWGIRGWATEKTAGLNLEHVKDDYREILACALHELFHRFQIAVCPRGEGRGFEAILAGPKELDYPDRLFHRVLAYIYLEGSAQFVCDLVRGPQEHNLEKIQEGLDLLEEIFSQIGKKDEEEIDRLINKGLMSNGPFYNLGEYMCKRIREEGLQRLRGVFLEGAPGFFHQFFSIQGLLKVSQDLVDRVKEMV